jgi:hypothetical protein
VRDVVSLGGDGFSSRPTRLFAAVLSQRLQHEVKVTECGFIDREPSGEDPHDGLTCSGTLEGAVRTVVELSGRDMRRRKLLLGSVFSVAAFAEPTLLALIIPPAQGTASAAGQRVGMADVEVLTEQIDHLPVQTIEARPEYLELLRQGTTLNMNVKRARPVATCVRSPARRRCRC